MAKQRKPAIPFIVRVRPEGTNGGKAWIIEINPTETTKGPAGYPCEFRRWEMAAVFIDGLKRGIVDQACFVA